MRKIGKPERICFLINGDDNKLCLIPYKKLDLKSHAVPIGVYRGTKGMRVYSKKLCQLIAQLHKWDTNFSYRIFGELKEGQNMIVFDLNKAEVIS